MQEKVTASCRLVFIFGIRKMKKTLFILLFVLFLPSVCYCQGKLIKWPDYENNLVRVGTDGTKLVKVWGKGSTIRSAIIQARKNALHASLIAGLNRGEYVMQTPPLCDDETVREHLMYLDKLINHAYDKYTTLVTDKVPAGEDMLHVRGGYKVGAYVQIHYDLLRKKLETDGIIRALDSGF